MSERRVAVTGIGIVSPLGRGCRAHLAAAEHGASGIRNLANFDASALSCRIGGEVDDAWLGDAWREYDRFARLALIASDEACAAAGLASSAIPPPRVGAVIGTGLGGSATLDVGYERLYGQRQSRVAPMTIPRSMYNAATSAVAARHGAEGPAFAVVSSCASATHAIAQGALWIAAGLADIVIAGGADAPLVHGVIRGWEALRVLAVDNERPDQACRPFSADRKGIVLAEGAAVFVLEEMGHARSRGAEIEGEIAGFGLSSDAGHVTDPSPDGAGRAMRGAMAAARLSPADIDYLNAHGTATRANDATETAAIRAVFGAAAGRLMVSSTKAMHGHAMGASGAIETALSLVALNEGIVPPTINRTLPDPACDLDYVAEGARRRDVNFFLSNSFGFGGLNGVLAIACRRAAGR